MFFVFKQKTAYEIGLGIPAEPLFRSMVTLHEVITFLVCKLLMLICILTKNVITSCSVTMMLFLHLEVKPLRSEERRVGKECRCRRAAYPTKKRTGRDIAAIDGC